MAISKADAYFKPHVFCPGMFDILVKYNEGISKEEEVKLPDEAVQSCISACYFGILWKQVR